MPTSFKQDSFDAVIDHLLAHHDHNLKNTTRELLQHQTPNPTTNQHLDRLINALLDPCTTVQEAVQYALVCSNNK